MRYRFWALLALLLLARPGEAFTTTVQVRAGVHPEFFRVVVEGPSDVIRSIDLGDAGGQKREIRISLSEDTVVELPPPATWKAGPVRSVRVEDYELVFAVDPTVPVETNRFHEPDRYIFDFQVQGVSIARDTVPPEQSETTAGTPGDGRERSPREEAAGEGGRQVFATARPRKVYSPDREAAGIQGIRRVAIDPGHGGYDLGLPGEKGVALSIARRLERALAGVGIRTMVTRTGNSYVTIGERIEAIRKFDPDVYLSIHLGRRYFRVYAGGAGSARRAALALKTRLHTAISLAYGDDALGEATVPVAMTEHLIYPGALVEIPVAAGNEDDASVDAVAGILLSALGKSEGEQPAASERKGWW